MRAPTFSATPLRPLRIDVTALVAESLEHPGRYHGLALRASGSGPGSACFSSGRRVGQGPRLELYLTPPPGDAGAPDAAALRVEAGQGGAGGAEPASGEGGASSG